ncbi:hydroxymethylbilane synthase [Glaciihabitans tibetensis]|uniref:Porphobilinogen deaminase n=1 Tax=Glaciihabitans tibetensis TaxID=1266600 RepID=A0A2T0VCJ0_9MICO|nr:hydroxymethylbilane synthase [Glaciihabitans tibetensis]PRY67893.1 hydroxymethylbilane synthase [Glaciihabitans tibetensis]
MTLSDPAPSTRVGTTGTGPIRIGTRGSALALAQTGSVGRALTARSGVPVELVPISTEGDRSKESLASLGGTGVFASALRDALLAGQCDAIVHSLKDLPTAPHPGLVIAAIPRREDARDALCARDGLTLDTLPEGSRVGTGSPRRQAQLRALRPDLEVVDIRGNIDTRLGRVGVDLDAVILAAAGLTRLGRLGAITEYLGISGWPTAPGQGALAIEVRAGDEKLVAGLDHRPTRVVVEAERHVLALLEAGCAAPIGANALIEEGMLFLSARVYKIDGSESLTSSHALYVSDVTKPSLDVASRVARELLDDGAATLAPLGGAL